MELQILAKGRVQGKINCLLDQIICLPRKNGHQPKCHIKSSCDTLMSQDDHFIPHPPHPHYIFCHCLVDDSTIPRMLFLKVSRTEIRLFGLNICCHKGLNLSFTPSYTEEQPQNFRIMVFLQ